MFSTALLGGDTVSGCFARIAIALWLPAAGAAAGTTIAVNFGPHPSAEAAARSEADVNWLDADTTDDTACTQCFAAVELQRCLRKMTGRGDDFPIIAADKAPDGDLILVGGPATNAAAKARLAELEVKPENLKDLGPEAYIIKSTGVNAKRSSVLLAGGGRVGTLYAVYDLLYRLGCRWFAPGELHEEIPKLDLDRWPGLDVTERPAFLTRGFHAWEDRGDPDFLLWMARNRLNYWCVEQSNHPLLHKLGIGMAGGSHDAQALFLNPASPYPYDHPRFDGDEAKPKDPYAVGELFQGDADKDGRLSCFEAHPEWFALAGGKRIPGIRGEFGANFCSSNLHATGEFMKNYIQALADGRYRDAGLVRFWTLDGGTWCQCDACKALGTPTDRNLLLVHRLDQEVKKARAAGRINRPLAVEFLAYADVLQPPTRPLPADFGYDTCYATFYPIVRCYVHNIDDPNCTANARYSKQLSGWATDPTRHYRGPLCIGEYYNVSGYKCLPICFMHTMANDIPYYYKAGARRFHYMHVTTAHWGNKALTNYQMARQLWEPQTDCEKLWDDYFARRYGPSSATLRRFYESLEKMLCNASELKYGLAQRLNSGAKDLFPTPHLRYRREEGVACDGPTLAEMAAHAKECRKLIAEALAAGLPEQIQARIAEDERLFAYGERTVLYYDACAQAFALARTGRPDDARRQLEEAKRLAGLLRQDTTSTKMSSSHASDANALSASRAAGALDHIAKLLPSAPAGGTGK